MNLNFDNFDTLKKELEGIRPLYRLAFASSLCERMLPNYIAFAREAGCGDPSLLRIALDEVWQILQGRPLDEPKINQLIQDCSNAPPDRDDTYDTRYLPEAEVAVIAITNTLYLCLAPSLERTVGIAIQVRETLVSFISLLESDSWDEKTLIEQNKEVAAHPLTVREMAKQSEDLRRLKEVATLDK